MITSILSFLKGIPFLFNIFSFLKKNFRYILLILGVVLILGVIGGFFLYQKSIINDLNKKIEEKQKQILALNLVNNELKRDNDSLKSVLEITKNDLERKEREIEEIRNFYKKVEEEGRKTQEKIRKLQEEIFKEKNIERRKNIRSSSKSSLLLKKENDNIKCFIENFSREGICKNGKFYPKN